MAPHIPMVEKKGPKKRRQQIKPKKKKHNNATAQNLFKKTYFPFFQ